VSNSDYDLETSVVLPASVSCLTSSRNSTALGEVELGFSVNPIGRGEMTIQSGPGRKVNILGDHSIAHSKKKIIYINMCPIPNGFRDRAI
jgi:hypothetical protein